MNEPEQEEVAARIKGWGGDVLYMYVLYIETKPPLTVRRNKTNDYYNQTATVSVLGRCMQEYIGTKGDWQAVRPHHDKNFHPLLLRVENSRHHR